MISILLVLTLTAHPACFADGHNQHRSWQAKAMFKRMHPCPGGVDKGSRKRCTGYVIDHWCPLMCCGSDQPSNMRWQSEAESKRKDKWEGNCSTCKKVIK